MQKEQKILVLVGPTASGKSALGVQLGRKFNGEVISADSRQVYRGLDIGTGKITKRETKGVPHHLLDIASPRRKFTAGDFVSKGRQAIDMIYHINKLPILVGGTGFYIDALVGRIGLPDVSPNTKLRSRLQKKSTEQLFALLEKKDPKRAKLMSTPSERNNKVRLIRALEIIMSVGSVRSTEVQPRYDVLWIGLRPPLDTLDKKIRTRLGARIRSGMVQEARRMRKQGLSLRRMRELGLEYRSLADLLERKVTKKEFEEKLYRDIRRYSRKQIGYWKRNKDIEWFDPKQARKIEATIRAWLRK
ncbi:tRNA (adenosine(37)-N6)-dimethylallyltransferase MiaA [Candidatus Kaiserbacteria bacterium]|nr:tRNA (adenosine(37)-N6)-dimethylallyltransferase MiaA [Candidatus Kaiserbacteria bacterium]